MAPHRQHGSKARFVPFFALLFGVVLLFTVPLSAAPPQSAGSPDIVIAQVYGGGGNPGAPFKNDYVVLFNRGTAEVDVSNWSVQYAAATNGEWSKTRLKGVIPAGSYYLISEAAGNGCDNSPCGDDLPRPDAIGSIDIAADQDKVALVTDLTMLVCGSEPGDCFPNSRIRDFVGYGADANNFEGSGPTGNLDNVTAALRNGGGCVDTDDNAGDFIAGAPAPRNLKSENQSCVEPTATPSATGEITETPTSETSETPAETNTASPTATPTFSPTSPSEGDQVYINEFLPHPASDWNGDGQVDSGDEWIEVYNANSFTFELSLWELDDRQGGSEPYRIPVGTRLAPYAFALFYGSETGIQLNDDGDDVRLLRPDGTVSDATSYSSSHPDESFARYPDGGEIFRTDCVPSPGTSNCETTKTPTVTRTPTIQTTSTPTGTPSPGARSVLINEFLPHPAADWNADGVKDHRDEWIELFNVSSRTVELGGWGLDDSEDRSKPYTLPPGLRIGPKSFLVFYGNQTHIGLNDDGDSVRLLRPDGTLADEVTYITTALDESYARNPDGGTKWRSSYCPSPGEANCFTRLKPTATPVHHLTSLKRARADRSANHVTVGGLVSVPPNLISRGDFWIQDASSGIRVHVLPSAGDMPSLQLWDIVMVRGHLMPSSVEREVRVEAAENIDVVGPGVPIKPSQIRTGAFDPSHEGLLVRVEGKVTQLHGREIYVDDGSGAVLVYIASMTQIDYKHLRSGVGLQVTGVVRPYRGKLEVVPRFPTDLVVGIDQTASPAAQRVALEGLPTATEAPTLAAMPAVPPTPSLTATMARPIAIARALPTAEERFAPPVSIPVWEVSFFDALLACASFLLFAAGLGLGLIAIIRYRAIKGAVPA